MQQKNLLLFLVLSFLIFVGWAWLEQKIWPPPPRPAAQTYSVPLPPDPQLWGNLYARVPADLALAAGVPGIGTVCQLATDLRLGEPRLRERIRFAMARPEPQRPPAPALAQGPHKEIPLRDDNFNLHVVLTTR